MSEKKIKPIPPEAWPQISNSEIMQLDGHFEELKTCFRKWATDKISDKAFLNEAGYLIEGIGIAIEMVKCSYAMLVIQVQKPQDR